MKLRHHRARLILWLVIRWPWTRAVMLRTLPRLWLFEAWAYGNMMLKLYHSSRYGKYGY